MMGKSSRTKKDDALEAIAAALSRYQEDHPRAHTKAYRHNSVAIRVRITDPDFAAMDKFQRHDLVWKYFDPLSEETVNQISMLLLLSPAEVKRSLANMDFDDPLPSTI
jgi:stress-induced morphogen